MDTNPSKSLCFTVDEASGGQRLDKVLESLIPEASLKARQKACDDSRVLVDGRPGRKGFRVRAGQRIELRPPCGSKAPKTLPIPAAEAFPARVLKCDDDFAALYKPGGMHTEEIANSAGECLQNLLPSLLPHLEARLLNRLDMLTSGIVMAGLSESTVDYYKRLQNRGKTIKVYLALVHGRLNRPLNIRNFIDRAKRRKVKVSDLEDPDILRSTQVEPFHFFRDMNATLVVVRIKKGARHQIRAHLARVGFPIAGDPLYGKVDAQSGPLMYLHHGGLVMKGFEVFVSPLEWPVEIRDLCTEALASVRADLLPDSGPWCPVFP